MSLRPGFSSPPPSPGAPTFSHTLVVPSPNSNGRMRATHRPAHKHKSSTAFIDGAGPPPPYFTTPPRWSLSALLASSTWKRSRLLRPALLLGIILFLVYKLRSSPSEGSNRAAEVFERYTPQLNHWRKRPELPAERGVGAEVFGGAGREDIDADEDADELDIPAPMFRKANAAAFQKAKEDAKAALLAANYGNVNGQPQPPSRAQIPPIVEMQDELEDHFFLPNGLLAVNPYGRHPIYDLIEWAEQQWADKVERQSRNLEEAVKEYRRRYGRKPPRGFDKWWAYVERHKIQLPDEYDQILTDLHMFYSYSPRSLRRLQSLTRTTPSTYTLSSSPSLGTISLTTANLAEGSEREIGMIRSREQLEMLRGYGETWIDEISGEETSVEKEIVRATGEWEATFGAGDVPMEFADWELYNERRVRARAGQTMDVFKKGDMTYVGWGGACPNSSPLRRSPPAPPSLPLEPPNPKTFIYSHRETMNPCTHPQLVHTVGFLSGHFDKGPGPQEVHRLLFGMCKTEGLHGDVLTVASEQWTEDIGQDPEWPLKTDDRVVWRGSNTGILANSQVPWRASQRVRMIAMLNNRTASHDILLPLSPHETVGEPVERKSAWLNHVLADVAFTRAPIQCQDGTCEELKQMFEWRQMLSQSEQNQYKYVLDIDGNGWSARFKRLLTTRSLTLKATIFPEWYMDRIQPWVHYVPIKMDLSDVYDVLTFFRGDVARGGEGGHEEMARKIGEAGRNWSLTMWRRQDLVAYQWRLFLEYGRLVSEDRDNMNFDF